MPISAKHRWIATGQLTLRQAGDTTNLFSQFHAEKLFSALQERKENHTEKRELTGKTLWLQEIEEEEHYYICLLAISDQTVADAQYANAKADTFRTVKKEKGEGGHVSSHVLIKKEQSSSGGHKILIENNTGLTLATISSYFTFILNDESYHYKFVAENGEEKSKRIISVILGDSNESIYEAINSGTLKSVDFVGHKKYDGALEIEPFVKEELHSVKLAFKNNIIDSTINQVQNFVRSKLTERESLFEKDDLFIKIRTTDGQNKTIKIDTTREDLFAEAFISHKMISGFAHPLAQAVLEIDRSIINKMLDVAGAENVSV